MITPEDAKNFFAIIGIYAFSISAVVKTATLYDQISLWGWKKGIKRWIAYDRISRKPM